MLGNQFKVHLDFKVSWGRTPKSLNMALFCHRSLVLRLILCVPPHPFLEILDQYLTVPERAHVNILILFAHLYVPPKVLLFSVESDKLVLNCTVTSLLLTVPLSSLLTLRM